MILFFVLSFAYRCCSLILCGRGDPGAAVGDCRPRHFYVTQRAHATIRRFACLIARNRPLCRIINRGIAVRLTGAILVQITPPKASISLHFAPLQNAKNPRFAGVSALGRDLEEDAVTVASNCFTYRIFGAPTTGATLV